MDFPESSYEYRVLENYPSFQIYNLMNQYYQHGRRVNLFNSKTLPPLHLFWCLFLGAVIISDYMATDAGRLVTGELKRTSCLEGLSKIMRSLIQDSQCSV
jgi:hypothetical protein